MYVPIEKVKQNRMKRCIVDDRYVVLFATLWDVIKKYTLSKSILRRTASCSGRSFSDAKGKFSMPLKHNTTWKSMQSYTEMKNIWIFCFSHDGTQSKFYIGKTTDKHQYCTRDINLDNPAHFNQNILSYDKIYILYFYRLNESKNISCIRTSF